jgi:hypothetical protein
MAPLKRKRATSVPASTNRQNTDLDFAPNPWVSLEPLGDSVMRTTSALAELAVLTHNHPETWHAQGVVTQSITHDFLAETNKSWTNGIEHGKWLVAEECMHAHAEIDRLNMEIDRLNDIIHRFNMG